MATVSCTGCGVGIAAEDIDLPSKLAKCRACGSVFDFRAQIRTPQENARRRRELIPPARFSLREEEKRATSATYRAAERARGVVHVRGRWFQFPALIGLAFVGMIDVSLVGTAGANAARSGAEPMIAFLLLVVTPLFLLTYLAASRVLNVTAIAFDDVRVDMRHGPLPFGRRLTTPSASIRSLHVQYRRSILARGGPYVYEVLADTANDPARVVVSQLPDEASARFVARAISERLALPDPT